MTTRRRLTEIASLVYSTSLFYCLINKSEFAVTTVRRGEQNGVIFAGVPFLRVNDIAMNMESCVITLKRRWPNAQIALSGLTYAPKRDNTKIDDINYC